MADKGPPGSFGVFGAGAGASVQFAADPAKFMLTHVDRHGPIWKCKLLGGKSMFVCGMSEVKEMLLDQNDTFPSSSSFLTLIRDCLAEPALMLSEGAGAMSWRETLGPPLNDVQHFLPLFTHLAKAEVSRWTAQPELALYTRLKELFTEYNIISTLDCGRDEAAMVAEWSTQQFRGCEAVPVNVGAVTGHKKGIEAKDAIVEHVFQRLQTPCPDDNGLPKTQFLPRLRAHWEKVRSGDLHDLAAQTSYVLHGLVPKAMASAVTSAFLDIMKHIDHQEQLRAEAAANPIPPGHPATEAHFARWPLLRQALAETLRTQPPLVAMTRGMKEDGEFHGYQCKGKWQAWYSIWCANHDGKAFENPHFWIPTRQETAHQPDTPYWECPAIASFGMGPRKCVGQQLAMSLMLVICHTILAAPIQMTLVPEQDMGSKYKPVVKPKDNARVNVRTL